MRGFIVSGLAALLILGMAAAVTWLGTQRNNADALFQLPPNTHYAPTLVAVDGLDMHVGEAQERGYPTKYSSNLFVTHTYIIDEPVYLFPTISWLSTIPNPFVNRHRKALDYAFQIVVTKNLPEACYVFEIAGKSNSIVLPLRKQTKGIYATPPWLPLYGTNGPPVLHGIPTFYTEGEEVKLKIKLVLSDKKAEAKPKP